MVKAEVRGQWVEKGVGVKEEMTMTIQRSSKELQLERDMRSRGFLKFWLKNTEHENVPS